MTSVTRFSGQGKNKIRSSKRGVTEEEWWIKAPEDRAWTSMIPATSIGNRAAAQLTVDHNNNNNKKAAATRGTPLAGILP